MPRPERDTTLMSIVDTAAAFTTRRSACARSGLLAGLLGRISYCNTVCYVIPRIQTQLVERINHRARSNACATSLRIFVTFQSTYIVRLPVQLRLACPFKSPRHRPSRLAVLLSAASCLIACREDLVVLLKTHMTFSERHFVNWL